MEMMILNIGFAIYFIITGYQWFQNRHHMTCDALHHMWSHTYIVSLFTISINWWILQGSWISLVFIIFTFGHLLQHVMKENSRLFTTNKWHGDVEDAS